MTVQKSLGGAAVKNFPGSKSRTQLLFLDDLNCARADAFGIQPPLELLRQILSEGTLMSHTRSTKQVKGRCLLIKKYFCVVYDYVGKAHLSKGY